MIINSFIIEISTEQQSNKMKSITRINDSSVTIIEYFQNMSMGLIYVYEYYLSEFEEFKTGLMADYNLKGVQQAFWIKPRNPISKPIILTFKEKTAPEYIEIAGEQAKTKV